MGCDQPGNMSRKVLLPKLPPEKGWGFFVCFILFLVLCARMCPDCACFISIPGLFGKRSQWVHLCVGTSTVDNIGFIDGDRSKRARRRHECYRPASELSTVGFVVQSVCQPVQRSSCMLSCWPTIKVLDSCHYFGVFSHIVLSVIPLLWLCVEVFSTLMQ